MTLRDLGLNDLQEQVYRALLQKPEHDLTTLRAQVDAATDDLRAALAYLVDLGVARSHTGSPSGVVMTDPAVSVGQLIERTEDELLRLHRRVANTRNELDGLMTLDANRPAGSDGGDGVERVDGLAELRDRIAELSFFTWTSVYSVQPGGPRSPASLEASRPLDLRGLRRGVEMRLIHQPPVLEDELNRAYLHEITTAGARVRLIDQRPERMIIMDEQIAVVPIDAENDRRGALIVRQPGLVTSFLSLFHRIWDGGWDLPMDTQETPQEARLTENERSLISLLASGNTDEVIARKIGISVRHLRRRTARLMARLQASSRFEAGAEAVRRGWI